MHDEARMPIGPHAGKLLAELDTEYLERCLGFDSSWRQYRPLFLQELERRRQVVMQRFDTSASEPTVVSADDNIVNLKVALPAWLVKRVKIDCVLRDLTMRNYVQNALKAALEPGRHPCES